MPAGHVLGLVLGQSDPDFTNADDQDATVQVDLGASTVTLPVAGRVALPAATVAPLVRTGSGVTARSTPADPRRVPDLR